MTALAKICGIRSPDTLEAALAGGADFVGFVFYPRSPRNVTPTEAAALAGAARGRSRITALVVDADDQFLGEIIATLRPDVLQLHGAETPERVAEIKARHSVAAMKAIRSSRQLQR